MLGKLLKYDLKWINKVLLLFYIIVLFTALVGRIFISVENSLLFNILGQICLGTSIALMINILINSLIRVWVRFINNIYKDESYLTHTLPVSKKSIYCSKIIAGILTLLLSFIVICIAIFICYYSKENIIFLQNLLNSIVQSFDMSIILFIGLFVLVIVLEFIFLLVCGILGIIIGHRSNNYRMLKSIIVSILLFFVFSIINLIILFLIALFNNDLMNVFNTIDVINMSILKKLLYYAISMYLIFIAVYLIIGKKLFLKGVNVE